MASLIKYKNKVYIISLATLLYIIPNTIFAQQAKFKASLGISLSQIDNDGMSGYHKNGLTAGLMTQFPLKKDMLWSIGMKYVNKGSKKIYGEFGPIGGDGKWEKASLHYVDLPIIYTYIFKKKIYISTGPVVGILVGGNIEFTPFTKYDARDTFKKLEQAWVLSVAYNFTKNWLVQVSTEASFISTAKGNNHIHPSRYFGYANDNILIELVKIIDSK
ncbi:MAG: porin family protein [Bacteroidota bacterium]|nr:porin family protein [Bacteroidota bacterium]